MVQSVFFADRVVWSNPVAIDVSVFNQNSQLRNLLGGQELDAGLDITINGHMTQKGRFCAILTGKKPL